jgi:hypothetical protein
VSGIIVRVLELPPLAGLMDDPGVDTTGDARMLAAYLRTGHALPPLPMSIGDPYLLGVARHSTAASNSRIVCPSSNSEHW